MAARRTFITVSWSIQRGDHGEQPYWAAIALASMLGRIGLPGGGVGFGFGSEHKQGNPTSAIRPPRFPAGRNPVETYIPASRWSDALLNPGAPVDFDGQRLTFPDIRLLHLCGSNPFHHQPDSNRVIAALHRPETIIVHEPWWTPTARMADIVLPSTTTVERNDLGNGELDRFLIAMKQAIAPVGQARNDHDVLADVADALGFRSAFTEGLDENGWLRRMYQELRRDCAASGFEMPAFDTFWHTGMLQFPSLPEPCVEFADFRRDPDSSPLRTPSGRIEIFSETIAAFGYDDCPGHPTWIEPSEWLGQSGSPFQLHLLSHQPTARLHSQLDMGRESLASKVAGREPILIHPVDAASRGIADGDVVRVFNDRGHCLAGARVTSAIRPDVVCIATGAWFDPTVWGAPGALDKHGNVNMLTLDKGTSKLAQGPSAQTALVEVERWTGPLPAITAHVPPARWNE
jgi:biotin/methionine sulfoxide reductase